MFVPILLNQLNRYTDFKVNELRYRKGVTLNWASAQTEAINSLKGKLLTLLS